MYKKAIKVKLRIQTCRGLLNVEQVRDLKKGQLMVLLRELKKELKTDTDDDLAFLDDNAKQVDEIAQLRFDIVKDIYLDKKAEESVRSSISELNREEQELLAIAADQQNKELRENPELVAKRLEEIQKKKAELG